MNIPLLVGPLPLASVASLTISFNQSDGFGKAVIYILIVMSIVACRS